jgi:IS5 family transposase
MNKQISLSALSDELAQVKTHKKEFLSQMDRIITWSE